MYKQALDAHVAYTVAKTALTAALLASTGIGTEHETYLKATMHPVPVYSLSPRQIVDAQRRKRSQAAVATVDHLRPAGISTSSHRSCPASPKTACFPWPGSRGGACYAAPHLQSTFLLLLTIPETKMALRPVASLVLVLADDIAGITAGTTPHNVV